MGLVWLFDGGWRVEERAQSDLEGMEEGSTEMQEVLHLGTSSFRALGILIRAVLNYWFDDFNILAISESGPCKQKDGNSKKE